MAVVGRDPRTSGEFLEAAVVAGLASAGVDVLRLGVLPTPAVAYLTGALDADFGVMLSASHNPAPDNGIKFFARGGLKLPDEAEDEIERRLKRRTRRGRDGDGPGVPALGFGRVTDASVEQERYLDHLLSIAARPGAATSRWPGCGWWSTVRTGPPTTSRPGCCAGPGAEVITIGVEPDGDNINSGCGSTSLDTLKAAVAEHGADAGIAHDGDADRCLAVDADGEVIDGDQIIAVLAFALKDAGRLADDTVVVTVMSNLGLRVALRDAGITVVETPVGDRYLVAAMREGKYVLGGEQSGHIILLDHATTGDGLLTALHLLATAAGRGQPLGRAGQGDDQVPPGADQRARGGQDLWWARRPSSPTRSGPPRPSWANPAGCWSGRAAPSPWSGSWSRRWTPARRGGSPTRSRQRCGTWPEPGSGTGRRSPCAQVRTAG